jgi:tRNA threonylcarbamoyladenosine biosynthesis protein TsaE
MFISHGATETQQLGAQLAADCQPGNVFALVGDVGAGKTQFVKGFVAAIDETAVVTSPTFTLLHEYIGGGAPIYHFDFYRVENVERLAAIGADDYLAGDGVSLVEWADRFPNVIPPHARWIHFRSLSESEREIRIEQP